jgi:1-acyl-sn-glycerol-3-phosphate acyltransferase
MSSPEATSQPARPPSLVTARWQPALWGIGRCICRAITTQLFDLRTYHSYNVPRAGGALLISNHQSNLDPVLLAVNLHRQVDYMAKAELFENSRFAWLIRALNALPVRRGEGDIAAVKEVIRRVGAGRVVTVFPEGTRTRDGQIGTILPGIAVIVRRAQAPVIPAVIDGSFQAWPKGSKLPRAHPIRIMYGKAMNFEGMKANQIIEEIGSTMRRMLAALREMN